MILYFHSCIYLCRTVGREGPELVRGGCSARDGVERGFFYFQLCIYLCRTGGREGPELVRGGCGARDGVRGRPLCIDQGGGERQPPNTRVLARV
jgi:hypothetical protein